MYTIGKFAKKIGKTTQTLRDWDKKGILKPAYTTTGKHRVYSEEQLQEIINKDKPKEERINVGYARVSSKHQEKDLERQKQLLESYLVKKGKPFKILSDIGSGINYNRKGLKKLLEDICRKEIDTIFVLYKDRLMRFANELIEELCRLHSTKIEIINQTEEKKVEEELVEDILNIIHVFSCKINGKRGHLNKKIIEKLSSKNET